jgi:ubiquinone/menaquinone biosynthesis C-methylase UbiE
MRRVVRPELLDSGDAPQQEVLTSLADLKRINRWFGGISTTKHLIQRALSRSSSPCASILDVGAAAGDGPRKVCESFPQLRFTLLDRDRSHFDGTRSIMSCVAGDALTLPFAPGSFDFVTCSLFAHHLEPEELRAFANEALRVARTALLINDLRRSAIHLGLVYLGQPLFRSRITRHDTVASVQRAYTAAEMKSILYATSAREVEIHNTFLYRMGAIAWK